MRPWCISHRGRFFDASALVRRLHYFVCVSWFALLRGWSTCSLPPGLTLLFLGVVVGLGTAFVWMLWEIEQMSKPHRNSDRFG
jgi:hypothetical protein